MIRTIYLHGKLKNEFGESFRFDAKDVAEVGKAFNALVPGFRDYVTDKNLRVHRGPLDSGFDIDENQLELGLGKTKEIHIFPAPVAAGGDNNFLMGAAKIVAGIAFVGIGFFALGGLATMAGKLAIGIGASMTLSGVSTMLSPTVAPAETLEDTENQQSHLFNGAGNTTRQGGPVPLVYGKMRTGSHVASSGIAIEEIPV
ncbi:putative phage tail protein [Labrenzia sp. EL_195]|nr:putative phage tail protein [Labrenzia sp. EL_195]